MQLIWQRSTGITTTNDKRFPLYNAILDGDVTTAKDEVWAALLSDPEPEQILGEGMLPAMQEVGRRFEAGDYYVPEMLGAARAMQSAL